MWGSNARKTISTHGSSFKRSLSSNAQETMQCSNILQQSTNSRTLLLLTSLLVLAIAARSCLFHPVQRSTIGVHESGSPTTIVLDAEKIQDSPSWSDARENPPLSPKGALRIARDYLNENLRESTSSIWYLESLSLFPLDVRDKKWCWFVLYRLYARPGWTQGSVNSEFYGICILMDGTVIPCTSGGYTESLVGRGLVDRK